MSLPFLPEASRLHLGLTFASLAAIFLHILLGWAQWPLIFVAVGGGLPLLVGIVRDAFKGDFGADLLAALALVVAWWLGEYLAATLIVLMLASGQTLESFAKRKASAVLLALSERMPSVAHRKEGANITDIAIADIAIGDLIVVYPHETCPVDGMVVEGHGTMDESYLTGEPYRVSKAPGVAVLSGAVNGNELLVIRAEKLASDSRYASIMQVMADAEAGRPRLRRLADQLGAAFAPLAFAIALIVWFVTGDTTRFLAVLVVATPCPLLIAIPVVIVSAISLSAKRGIIIRDPTVLERLPTCRTAIFDKTGTLTYGQPELSEIITAPGIDAQDVLQLAASMERYSKHPLAIAILAAARKAGKPLLEASHVSEHPGQGLTGTVHQQQITITHRRKLQERPEILSHLPPEDAGLECIILIDDRYAATLRMRDKPREDGKSFIGHLAPSHQFERVMLVSGDRESEVTYLAKQLGIRETLASQTPEQKLAIVRAQAAMAPTLFMGDGINDAPALAAATVGLAFGQHSGVTSEAAGAVVLDNTLEKVDELIHISEAMRKIALQSALGGMALSLVGMGFAASGHLTPAAGALLQEIIDVAAILNALRLTWHPNIRSDMH